jgi:hypothetical protein
LRNAATLGDSVIGKFSALPFLPQQPNDFHANRLIMRKPIHRPSVWQEMALDMYFSDVQHWASRAGRNQREYLFTKLAPKRR